MPEKNEEKIAFGLVHNFRFGEPVLLFLGNRLSIILFSEYILNRPLGGAYISESPLFCAMTDTKVFMRVKQYASGLKLVTRNEANFEWGLSPEKCSVFSVLLTALADSPSPSHQYLDCNEMDDISVVVSKDEYSLSVFSPL